MNHSGSAGFNGLELRALSRRAGGHTLVDQLSLQVAPGEILALLGPSGCGKSSTLRLIAGLDAASSGEIHLGGRSITGLPPAERLGPGGDNLTAGPGRTKLRSRWQSARARG